MRGAGLEPAPPVRVFHRVVLPGIRRRLCVLLIGSAPSGKPGPARGWRDVRTRVAWPNQGRWCSPAGHPGPAFRSEACEARARAVGPGSRGGKGVDDSFSAEPAPCGATRWAETTGPFGPPGALPVELRPRFLAGGAGGGNRTRNLKIRVVPAGICSTRPGPDHSQLVIRISGVRDSCSAIDAGGPEDLGFTSAAGASRSGLALARRARSLLSGERFR